MLDRDSDHGGVGPARESVGFEPQGEHRREESLMEWQRRLTDRQTGSVVVADSVELGDAQQRLNRFMRAHTDSLVAVGIDLSDEATGFSVRYRSEIQAYFEGSYHPYSEEVTEDEVQARILEMAGRKSRELSEEELTVLTHLTTWAYLDSQGRGEEIEARLDELEEIS